MKSTIQQQIRFALEDDNEVMTAALDSDLDEENKQMNRDLIKRHEKILNKLDRGVRLSQEDLQLIRDANEIHRNDTENLGEHHVQAMMLDQWLDRMDRLSRQAMGAFETYLCEDLALPPNVQQAMEALKQETTPNGSDKPHFDDNGKCLACGSSVSFADVTDTLVFVGDEIVKRYDGDISNRNCVRCTYPKQYADFRHYDEGDGK